MDRPLPRNCALELHDSHIAAWTHRGGEIVIRLSPAIMHRSAGIPGVNAGDVFTLDVDITLRQAAIVKPFASDSVELASGCLACGDRTFENCIAFPLHVDAKSRLTLIDIYGDSACFEAEGVSLAAVSGEVYLESFPGSG